MGKQDNSKALSKANSKQSKKVMKKPLEIVSSMRDPRTDPQGSYTGVCADINEVPVQDADDL